MAMNMDILSALKFGNPAVGAKGAAQQSKPAMQRADKADGFRRELIAASRNRKESNHEKGDVSRTKEEILAARLDNGQKTLKKVKAPEKETQDQEKENKETKPKAAKVLEELIPLLERLMNTTAAEETSGEDKEKLIQQLMEVLNALEAEGEPMPEQMAASVSQLAAAVGKLLDGLKPGGIAAGGTSEMANAQLSTAKEAVGEAIREMKALMENMQAKELHDAKYQQSGLENTQKIKTAQPEAVKKDSIKDTPGERIQETKDSNAKDDSTPSKEVHSEVRNTEEKPGTAGLKESNVSGETAEAESDEAAEKKALDAKLEDSGKHSQDENREQASGQREVKVQASKVENPVQAGADAEKFVMPEEQAHLDRAKATAVQEQASRASNATKSDVINQIVKKAEFIIKDAQQELRMQLEPENLGKLTLKVAVERGLITAKFVAESQQVKEIIESNFNQLKDMLEEKGIAVQSFSVSVGQDNKWQDQQNQFQMWKETIRANGRSSDTGRHGAYGAEDVQTVRAGNPYNYHDGKVDFKA